MTQHPARFNHGKDVKRIAIIGGGFAGTAAAKTLFACGSKRGPTRRPNCGHEVHLFDPREGFEFLPLLPDIIGGRYSTPSVVQGYATMADRLGFRFHQQKVIDADLEARSVTTGEESFTFDYLLIATGAETNWHGDEEARQAALPLRSAAEAAAIVARLESRRYANVVVIGGGYTGIEAASQIVRYSRKTGISLKVTIAEHGKDIISGGEAWMQQYLRRRLEELSVDLRCGTSVEGYEVDSLILSDGSRLQNCLAVWTAGARAAGGPLIAGAETDEQGRLRVDSYLRAAEGCYAAGDSVRIEADGKPLPMASYLAVSQGKQAAGNILREIAGKSPRNYRPRYLGFVIPLADGRGCGRLIGLPLSGLPAALVHHGAAILRTHTRGVRGSMIRELLREGIGMPR